MMRCDGIIHLSDHYISALHKKVNDKMRCDGKSTYPITVHLKFIERGMKT